MDDIFGASGSSLPPRYALESDSSESEFEDPEAGYGVPVSKPKSAKRAQNDREPVITVSPEIRSIPDRLFVALDRAGEIWTSGFPPLQEQAVYKVDGAQFANLVTNGTESILCISSTSIPLSALYPIVESIVATLKPSSIQIIDAYSVETYLSSSGDHNPVIRYFSTSSTPSSKLHCEPFEIPNMVQGLAAALMTHALVAKIESELLLLPVAGDLPRPDGIYDPTSNALDTDDMVYSVLSHVVAKDLAWPASWQLNHTKRRQGWAWKREQDRLRERQTREAGTDHMYM